MKATMFALLLGTIATVVALNACTAPENMKDRTTSVSPAETYYTCPMHPQIHAKEPGSCPICGMTLVRVDRQTFQERSNEAPRETINMSVDQQVRAHVSVSTAAWRSLDVRVPAPATLTIPDYAQRVLTLRFPGRIERLYILAVGQQVVEGDPVADVFSPEAISAEREYLVALAGNDAPLAHQA